MATSLRLPLRVAFPRAAVEARLRAALATQATDQAVLRDRPPPARLARSAWEPEIDSLLAVELICAIEEQLGLKLPAWFAPGTRLVLDLGAVKEIAEVAVDGVPVAILWKRPFRVDVTRAL